MNNEHNYSYVEVKNESVENEAELEESPKSNGFLYVDISEYNDNNLDGIEIKEEEEQVEVLSAPKNVFQTSLEETFPLNSLKNLANHSEHENNTGEKSTRSSFSSISFQKENFLDKTSSTENSEQKRYKLRGRTWSQRIDFNLLGIGVKRKRTKKKYVCMGCQATFINETSFLNHETEVEDFKCIHCFKCFCTANLLDQHLQSCKLIKNNGSIKFNDKKCKAVNSEICPGKDLKEHGVTRYKCDRCKKSFTKKYNLVSHIRRNNCSLKIYSCAICQETMCKKSSLRKHIVTHLSSQLQCQHCFQTFENHKNLNNHSCKLEIDNTYASLKCNSTSGVEVQLDKSNIVKNSSEFQDISNSESSDNTTIHECQMCKKVFKGNTSYEKHLAGHKKKCDISNKKDSSSQSKTQNNTSFRQRSISKNKKKFKYECDTCGKGFIKLLRLKIHILNIHQGVNFQCGKCNVKFSNQEDLDTHTNAQDCKPEDLSTCKTCGKVFAKKDYLKKHQYMHMNVLFKCKYCYGAFMKEKSYKRHMERKNCSKSARKIRMAEFNFKKCRICEIEYDTEELLINHFKESHVGLEPHQCFCCDSCLPTFQDLQNHIHQHNIQKYTCNLCGKPYTSQEGFRKHRLKHKGAEFKCQFCCSEFLNESRYKFHVKTCKKNPESGYEPSQEKEKPKKKDEKPKQSRQLHWESRIIMKRLRGDPQQLTGNQTSTDSNRNNSSITSTFFDDPDSDSSDDRGWFSNYYRTDEDDIAFGLKKADEPTPQNCEPEPEPEPEPELEMSELRTRSTRKKKKITPPPSDLDSSNSSDESEVNNDSDSSYQCPSSVSEASSNDSDEVECTDLPIDYNPKKCRLCVINFAQEYELLHHFIKTHPGEMAHKCPQCEVQSPLFAQLREHLKIHGIGIGIFNCDNCSKQFKSKKKLNAHNILCKGIDSTVARSKKSTSQITNESCKNCGKKFRTKFGYRRHKQLCKTQNKSENSEKLNDNSDKSGSKEDEVFDNSSGGNDTAVSDSEKDEEEEVLNTKDNPVPQNSSANTDDSNSTKPSDVSVNAEEHLGEEKNVEMKNSFIGEPPMDSFPCRLCDKKFQYERGIVMHFKTAHPGHKPLICHVCNMHLADKLKEHLKTHGIGEEFICELCGKRFNQKFLSKIHEMWHQGIEYKCNNCKQKFLNKEKMDKHIGENRCSNRQSLMRLPCDICGKSYRSKFGLSKHYITHTPKELRPVKNRMNCEFCGKWFEYNNGLQRHRRIHTGERPFCCRYCPKAFAQEGNCKAHERIHTGETKPRKKGASALTSGILPVSSETPQSSALNSEIPSFPSTVESVTYPGHINLYIYNNIDPNGIVN